MRLETRPRQGSPGTTLVDFCPTQSAITIKRACITTAKVRSTSTEPHRMTPYGCALWYIESHYAEELTLDGVAQIAGVSRFHLTRAFGLGAGMPLVKYRRGRRLTAHLTSGARVGHGRTRHPGAGARCRLRLPALSMRAFTRAASQSNGGPLRPHPRSRARAR